MDGLITIVFVPPHVTRPDVTSIVSAMELSDSFLIVIVPVPTKTFSEKTMLRSFVVFRPVKLSDG